MCGVVVVEVVVVWIGDRKSKGLQRLSISLSLSPPEDLTG